MAGKTHSGADWRARLPGPRKRENIKIGAGADGAGKRLIAKLLRFAAAALFVALTAQAAAQTSVDEAERGIVRVVVILEGPEGRMLYGSGSGFVVAPNLVVTNAHVVAPARQRAEYGVAVVPPHGDGLLTARIIRYSPLSELALLEFQGGEDLPPVTISTVEPNPGDAVLALGYPDVDYQGASGRTFCARPRPRTRAASRAARPGAHGDLIPTINHEAVISSGSSGGRCWMSAGGCWASIPGT